MIDLFYFIEISDVLFLRRNNEQDPVQDDGIRMAKDYGMK
jgi:hypothetical protein